MDGYVLLEYSSVCVCVCERECVCVGMYVCVYGQEDKKNTILHTHTYHRHTHTHIHLFHAVPTLIPFFIAYSVSDGFGPLSLGPKLCLQSACVSSLHDLGICVSVVI